MPKPLLKSFSAGEVTPELFGRVDLAPFQTAVQLALNFAILPHGPAENRAGLEFVAEALQPNSKTRVIPFYTESGGFIIELSDMLMTFYGSDGSMLYNTDDFPTACEGITISSYNPYTLYYVAHGLSTGMRVYFPPDCGVTQLVGRTFSVVVTDADHFYLKYLAAQGGGSVDGTGWDTPSSYWPLAQLTTTYAEADLFDIGYTQNSNKLTLTHPEYATQELTYGGSTVSAHSAVFVLNAATFDPSITSTTAPTATPTGSGGSPTNHYYVTTAIKDISKEESYASPQSAAASLDLSIAGNYITVLPATVSGAVRYNVYKLTNGLYGYVGQCDDTNGLIDDNITPDMSITPPLPGTDLSTADDYPGCAGYAQGRRIFGGTNNNPQEFFMTRSGTESNMSYSIPTRDDDAIEYTLKAQKSQRVRHIVPLGSLIMLTQNGLWEVSTVNTDVLTPSSVWPKQRSGHGASRVRAEIAGAACLYVDDSGQRVNVATAGYDSNGQYNGISVADASILAPHLFRDHQIVDATYSDTDRTSWFVRDDGILLGFTYLPEQKIMAWHHHQAASNGIIESVASVREYTGAANAPNYSDVLFCVVRRIVNGAVSRYIERISARYKTDLDEYFFVDSGLTYDGKIVLDPDNHAPTFYIYDQQAVSGANSAQVAKASQYVHDVGGQKFYFEVTINSGTDVQVGVAYDGDSETTKLSAATHAVCYDGVGTIYNAGAAAQTGLTALAADDIVGVAIDHSAHTVQFYINGTAVGTAETLPAFTTVQPYPAVSTATKGKTFDFGFRRTDLGDRLPTGFEPVNAITSVTGMWHLEGEEVYGLADGGVVGPFTVDSNGGATLDSAAQMIHMGLQITADFQTMPMVLEQQQAAGQGMLKNISNVLLRVWHSAGIWAGPDFDSLKEMPPRVSEAYGTPPDLKNGIVRMNLTPKWQTEGSICIRHTAPLPLTLLSMTLDAESQR